MNDDEIMKDMMPDDENDILENDQTPLPQGGSDEALKNALSETTDEVPAEAMDADDPENEPDEAEMVKPADATAEAAAPEKPKRRGRRAKATESEKSTPDIQLGFQPATRREKRELYGAGQKVFTLNPEDDDIAEQQVVYDLENARRSGKILNADLIGVELYANTNLVCGVAYYEDFKIYIPQPLMFPLKGDPDSPEYINNARWMIREHIGSEIDFTLLSVDEANRIAMADHLRAVTTDIQENYYDKHNGHSNIEVGTIAEAKITFVAKRGGIGINIGGVETYIPPEDLSWLYFESAKQEGYFVGNIVRALVKNVKPYTYETQIKAFGSNRKFSYSLLEVTASVKETMPDPSVKYYNDFKVGGLTAGIITGQTEAGYFVRIANKRDSLADDNSGSRRRIMQKLPNGTKVTVRITKKEDKDHKIYCRILDIIKIPD